MILKEESQDNIIPKILKQRWIWHAALWFVYFAVSLPSEIRTLQTSPLAAAKLGIHIEAWQIAVLTFGSDIFIILYS